MTPRSTEIARPPFQQGVCIAQLLVYLGLYMGDLMHLCCCDPCKGYIEKTQTFERSKGNIYAHTIRKWFWKFDRQKYFGEAE